MFLRGCAMSNKRPSSRIKMNYVEEKFIRQLLSVKMWKTTRGFSTMLLRVISFYIFFFFFRAFFIFIRCSKSNKFEFIFPSKIIK